MKQASFLSALFCLFFTAQLFSQRDYRVHFRYEKALFAENLAVFQQNPAVEADEIIAGRFVRLVQFFEIPMPDARARMEASGLVFMDYFSFAAWLVAIPVDFEVQKLTTLGVRSISKLETRQKLHRSLTERPFGPWAALGNGKYEAVVQVFPFLSIDEGAAFFHQKGIEIIKKGHMNGILTIALPEDMIEKAASWPFVKWLELAAEPPRADDTHGRAMHRSHLLNSDFPEGKKYDATGLGVQVRDDGPLGPHIDFQGRLHNLTTDASGDVSHGDGVGGIMAGAGNLDPTNKGMASGATIYVTDYQADFQDSTTLPLHLDGKVTVTNSSYSDGCNAGYTTTTQTVDQQLFEHPYYMHVFSAGNMGTANCQYGAGAAWGNITGGHKQAKNCLTTANLLYDLELEVSSSRGPAYDGRLKPDLAAHGQDQVSTDSDNKYQVFGGTSAASPGDAGVFAQLFGAYKSQKGVEPEAALVKAAMLVSANDMGNAGPDFKFGWGHLNAYRALNVLENNRFQSVLVNQDDQMTATIQIPSGAQQVRIMAYWAEKEGSELTDKALLNDLDLTVETPTGSVLLPLVLDPSPTVAALNSVAVPGIDNLNNVEEVILNAPAAGSFLVKINGKEVPEGPQKVWIVWEIITEAVKMIYPAGGEGLVPGETETLFWDATGNTGSQQIELSLDGGQTWQGIVAPTAATRSYDYDVPNALTSKARFRIKRGSAISESSNFSIIGQPDSVVLEKTCPTEMTVRWTPVAGATRYDVFKLGQYYMDSVGSTSSLNFAVPITSPLQKYWVAVRAAGADGLRGRRTIAVEMGGGLIDCAQPRDLQIAQIISPYGSNVFLCEPTQMPVNVRVKNIGLEAINDIPVKYQFGVSGAVVSGLLTKSDSLKSGESFDFEFLQKLDFSQPTSGLLTVWLDLANESARYNDTMRLDLVASISSGVGPNIAQDFESGQWPVQNWAVVNPDGLKTWELSSLVVGSDGNATQAALMNFFNYPDTPRLDFLISEPYDLTATPTPSLFFEHAYAPYSGNGYEDGLIIEVRGDCGQAPAQVIFEKYKTELGTAAASANEFSPSSKSQWRQTIVPIPQFAGQKIVVSFIGKNAYGNNLYLDNILVTNNVVEVPLASYSTSADSICRGDTIVFSNLSTGGLLTYDWKFGAGATPTASLLAGPHYVKYSTAGSKVTSLKITNPAGTATKTKNIFVKSNPTANFTFVVDQNNVIFTNASNAVATDFLWEFGDGATSTEKSPLHTFSAQGIYTVKLTSSSECGAISTTKQVNIMVVSTKNVQESAILTRIQPNPTDGPFELILGKPLVGRELLVEILDAQGRVVYSTRRSVDASAIAYRFEKVGLAKGFYSFKFQTEKVEARMLKLLIQ